MLTRILGLCALSVSLAFNALAEPMSSSFGSWSLACEGVRAPANCVISQKVFWYDDRAHWARADVSFNVYGEPEILFAVPASVYPWLYIAVEQRQKGWLPLDCDLRCEGDFRLGKGWIHQLREEDRIVLQYRPARGALGYSFLLYAAGLDEAIRAVTGTK